jgi:putative oxidoreductase
MKRRGMSMWTLPFIPLFLRLVVGIIFLYAGFIKIVDPPGFAQALYNYRLLPGWTINPIAIILPWLELVVGGSLVLGIWTLGGGVVASSLLGIFACAIAINLIRGLDISCGCFGTAATASPITWFHLAADLVLLGMGVSVVLFDQGMLSLDRLLRNKSR